MSCFENEINVDKYINIDNYLSITINNENDLSIDINYIYRILCLENNKYFYKLIENINNMEPGEKFFIDSAILEQIFKFYLKRYCPEIELINACFQGSVYCIDCYKTDYPAIKQDIINYIPTTYMNDNGFTINMQKNINEYKYQTIPTVTKICSIIISSKGNF